MAKTKKTLGRGLSGLIAKGGAKLEVKNPLPYEDIDIEVIKPNPYQPRLEISAEAIKELAGSIKRDGLLQPVVVRKRGEEFELIAGERRLRACKSLRMKKVQARVVDVSDASSAVMALVENLQRENLNPVDEAMGYSSLMRDFDLTQEQVSEKVGKPRASVANMLRLLNLEQEIQGFLAKGMLSTGHAKVLLSVEAGPMRLLLARRVLENGFSVREAEKLASTMKKDSQARSLPRPTSQVQSVVLKDLEKQLTGHFSTPVSIKHGARKGQLVIDYKGNEDLNRILEKIGFLNKTRSAA